MSGRPLIIALIGLVVISAGMLLVLLHSSDAIATNFTKYYSRQSAQDIAQSGVNMALRKLISDSSWRAGWSMKTMQGGSNTVMLADTVCQSRPAVRIMSIGYINFGNAVKDYDSPTLTLERRDTTIAYFPRGFIPGAVRAAITTNNPVLTLGTIAVDGRDHDLSGALVPNEGTLGIWTTGTYVRSGGSTIGGTDSTTRVDIAPTSPADPRTYEQNQVWPGGYPSTPDAVFGGPDYGYPDGFLKSLAQSHIGGSQYVTDPTMLTSPFRGVTYVELPSGATWQSMDITGSGILIVHNTMNNAIMKNLNSGTFVGMMIVDDLIHFHGATLIGAAVCLSPSPSEGNCIGNSQGNVKYSRESIGRLTDDVYYKWSNGTANNVIAWWE